MPRVRVNLLLLSQGEFKIASLERAISIIIIVFVDPDPKDSELFGHPDPDPEQSIHQNHQKIKNSERRPFLLL